MFPAPLALVQKPLCLIRQAIECNDGLEKDIDTILESFVATFGCEVSPTLGDMRIDSRTRSVASAEDRTAAIATSGDPE